jgi:single-strand DNA-binding protein
MSVNKSILLGNLGSDPEVRTTNSGQNVVSFSLATNEKWTSKDGKKNEHTEWHRITAWGGLGESCAKYLKKGQSAYVEGRIHTTKYSDKKTGEDRYSVEVVATEVKFLSRPETAGPQKTNTPATHREENAPPIGGDDDVPF